MQFFFVIIALVLSSILLFRTVINPKTPRFSVSDRLTADGAIYEVTALAARSAVTERCGGVTGRKVRRSIKKRVKSIEKSLAQGDIVCAVLDELYKNRHTVMSACDRAMRAASKSYLLGAVDGVPRVFALCDSITANTRGAVTCESIVDAVHSYNKFAPLNFNEISAVPDMLRLCVCGLIGVVAEISFERDESISRGEADGRANKVNLDLIFNDEYICGLCKTTDDLTTLRALLEHNGISIEETDVRRRKSAAELAAVMHSCIFSLNTADRLTADVLARLSVCDEILCANEHYQALDGRTKCACLEAICKRALKLGISETFVANEAVNIAELTRSDITDGIFPKNVVLKQKIVATVATAVLSLTLFTVAAIFMPRLFLWFAIPIGVIIYVGVSGSIEVISYRFTVDHFYLNGMDHADNKEPSRIVKYIIDSIPFMQLILLIACSICFDLGVFLLALFPLIAEILCVVFLCAVEASVRPLKRLMIAIREFISIPVKISDLALKSSNIALRDRERIGRVFQAATAITVISLSAVFGNIAISVGAVFLIPAFFDNTLHIRRVRKAVSTDGEHGTPPPNDAECVCFCEHSPYSVNLFDNALTFVTTDSRGTVEIRYDNVAVTFDILFHTPHGTVSLADCNGIAERHKTTYRAKSNAIEMSSELLAPPNMCGCICRTVIVNRSAENITCDIEAVCSLSDPGNVEAFERGIATIRKDIVIGLCLSDNLRFDSNIDSNGMSVGATLSVAPFCKRALIFAVMFAKDREALRRRARCMDELLYFERANVGAKVFGALGSVRDVRLAARLSSDEFDVDTDIGDVHLPTVVSERGDRKEELKRFGFRFNCVKVFGDDSAYCGGTKVDAARAREIAVSGTYAEVAEEQISVGSDICEKRDQCIESRGCDEQDFDFKTSFGGLLNSGESVVESHAAAKKIRRILGDEEACLSDNSFHIGAARAPAAICGIAIGKFDNAPIVFDAENTTSIFGLGYTENIMYFDCCKATLTKYFARGKGGAIFDIKIVNPSTDEKTFYVMFYADVKIPRPLRVGRAAKSIYVTDRIDGRGFAMISSQELCDYTPYREGYRRRSVVDKVTDFRNDGIKIAPAMSVKCTIAPNGDSRAVFCIAAVDGISKIDKIDMRSADDFLSAEKRMIDDIKRVEPKTTDRVLDYLYVNSLYDAYINGFLRKRMKNEFCALPCIAVKYVNPEEVKRMLISSGRMILENKIGLFDMLSYVIATKDYVDYTGDNGFYSEKISDDVTVGDCCVSALDDAVRSSTPRLNVIEYITLSRAVRIGCEVFRRNRYFAVKSELQSAATVDRSGGDIISVLSRALEAFEAADDLTANELMIQVNALYFNGDTRESLRLFGKVYNADSGDFSAVYHAIVTRYLFGIEHKGVTIEFDPHISEISPHIEYELISRDRENRIRVVIEDGEKRGAWFMRVGNITYAKNRINENEKIGSLLLLRDDAAI